MSAVTNFLYHQAAQIKYDFKDLRSYTIAIPIVSIALQVFRTYLIKKKVQKGSNLSDRISQNAIQIVNRAHLFASCTVAIISSPYILKNGGKTRAKILVTCNLIQFTYSLFMHSKSLYSCLNSS